ncbi:hypothetical protein [uncultured Sphaerochaeta sp.]|uniref:hypothetical protein n=1 Tax=uncultured Sphaerochaeta sp. TaxID=886478 RepID=UPI0029CA7521|nr:hypothetical protein [uncultured Sphaerochaeta sp.]
MRSTPMRIQLHHTWLHKKSSVFLLLLCILLLVSCRKEEIVVVNLEHERSLVFNLETGLGSEHLSLSFDLLGEERPVQVRLSSSNEVSSWIVDASGERTSPDTARYRVGPLTMGEGIPFSPGVYEITIINEEGIIRSEQIELPASMMEKIPEEIPHYDEESGTLSSIPVPSQLNRYDETGRFLSTLSLDEDTYTIAKEDFSLALITDNITYLVQP